MIVATRAIFDAELPNAYTHPSHLFKLSFREKVRETVFSLLRPLGPLIGRGQQACRTEEQRRNFDQLGQLVFNHVELQAYLEIIQQENYNVGFCGDINRFLYAYLNFVYKWPIETGRPHIEMVNFEIPSLIPGAPSRENHAVLLIGRDPQTAIKDLSAWNENVTVIDAYERGEDLQLYLFNKRPHRGMLHTVLERGAKPVRLLSN